MIFLIADTHFGHKNIIKYCRRPFSSIEEHDETIIERWNAVVKPGDFVYHAGDFALTSPGYAKSILKRLNGNICLCIGSHEKTALKCEKYFTNIRESYFIKVNNSIEIFISHYLHKVWNKSHYGSYHCHAHSHGGMDKYDEQEGKILDIGVDSHNFKPWHVDKVLEVMKTRSLNFNDLKRRKQ